MKKLLAVGFGGMLGAVLRTAVYTATPDRFELWIINLAGSFLLGWLSVRLSKNTNQELKLLLATGLLGSFTTFSAFSVQWFDMLTATPMFGFGYGVTMTGAAVALAALGMWTGQKGAGR